MSKPLADQEARDEALDVTRSFIVQAPAGSGKTELLILRFLKLLLSVEQPEQILAITFTRKAASEMRKRVIDALISVESNKLSESSGENNPQEQRLKFAIKVHKRNSEMNWGLITNPNRLRIQTIDSFCLYLANQLPILSRVGGSPNITQEVDECFEEAIVNTLSYLDKKEPLSSDIENILLHVDNDIERLQKLLASLLGKREQWLPYILEINDASNNEQYFENCIQELIRESITELKKELVPHSEILEELINYSTTNLINLNSDTAKVIQQLDQLPGLLMKDIPNWRRVIDLLLTEKGAWRKGRGITTRIGFKPGDKQKKDLEKLIGEMESNKELNRLLNYVRILPSSLLDSYQWNFVRSLTRLLIRLSSELIISFRNHGIVDYTQISAAAQQAIGSDVLPTDLTLALDHRIKHILVDEFQDTSQLQLEILKALIGGWERKDQRSLFLVGDPMQSCYGFRNADVGIYLSVQQKGLQNLGITSLQLKTNFRSDSRIINWVNSHFKTAFPLKADSSRGAVPYSCAVAAKPSNSLGAVSTDIIAYRDQQKMEAKKAEASNIIHAIEELRSTSPDESIAILVRTRGHLSSIIPELQNHGIPWESNEIDTMGEIQIIEDLLNLTKALLNPHDRLSWLGLLRAPWVGLNISDLHIIACHSVNQPIWECLKSLNSIQGVSVDGRTRLANFVNCIQYSIRYRYQVPLVELIESSWRLLRGYAVVETNKEKVSVSQYFDLIERYSSAGGISDINSFQNKVRTSFITFSANPVSNSTPIQVLTIHKAKGLEFDHVIIPGLANSSKSEDKSLLLWHERLNKEGQPRLLLSPIKQIGSEDHELYNLIRHEKKNKSLLEDTRLLYIAITRAKQSVKLTATASVKKDGGLTIPSNSLLAKIWQELNREASGLRIIELNDIVDTLDRNATLSQLNFPLPTPLRRFKYTHGLSDSEKSLLEKKMRSETVTETLSENADKSEKSVIDARIGDLIHEALEDYAIDKNKSNFLNMLAGREEYWKLQLQDHIFSMHTMRESIAFIYTAVNNCIRSKKLSWIFDESNKTGRSEFKISQTQSGKIRTYAIDRTLIDENGVRWIIDFKTGAPRERSTDEFIDQQKQLHAPQLSRYEELFQQLETRETKTAILFTAISKLVPL